MEYSRWAPRYESIRKEFGFPFDREVAAADLLERLLPPSARVDPLGRLRSRLEGREAIVVGSAPGAGPPPVWRLTAAGPAPSLIAADQATAECLRAGLVPTVVVTDLDGPVPSEITANRKGSLVVVHAHGDNVPALEEWVPQFPGELVGSWSGPPRDGLVDFGGFTDGDRAAYAAEEGGATRVLLWGFDFDRVEEATEEARARKLAKLRWARRLLADLDGEGRSPLFLWRRDGSVVRYTDDVHISERAGASTR